MPILTVTLDTETQAMTLTVDGNPVDNVSEVHVCNYGYDNDPHYSFSVTTAEKIGGVFKMIRLSAKEDPTVKEAIASGEAKPSQAIAGFVEVPAQTKAQEQIAAWHKSTRGR